MEILKVSKRWNCRQNNAEIIKIKDEKHTAHQQNIHKRHKNIYWDRNTWRTFASSLFFFSAEHILRLAWNFIKCRSKVTNADILTGLSAWLHQIETTQTNYYIGHRGTCMPLNFKRQYLIHAHDMRFKKHFSGRF